MRSIFIAALCLLFASCTVPDRTADDLSFEIHFAQYSKAVGDTFQIRIQLPLEYFDQPDQEFPTVVLLDGNFFYPMLAPALHQYETAGLLTPVILVSIGYRSFHAMDSLRVRDYLFPASMPSDEMEAIGGGQRFSEFIDGELLPGIDARFRADDQSRCLLGHSFGGYFVLYDLLRQLEGGTRTFKTFVAASPTLWYNEFYLNHLPKEIRNNPMDSVNMFLSVGALEDSVWSVRPLKDLAARIQENPSGADLRPRIFSHLEHMDVAMISFVKGLQEFLNESEQ